MKTALFNVSLATDPRAIGGGRMGTALLSLEDMRTHFGEPHGHGDGDKVTAQYYFDTPRGPIELRDYWWNSKHELSICGTNWRAALWLAAYFRALGIIASAYHTTGTALEESRWFTRED